MLAQVFKPTYSQALIIIPYLYKSRWIKGQNTTIVRVNVIKRRMLPCAPVLTYTTEELET